MDWYYKALRVIEREFEDDLLTLKEYQQALRDLDSEFDESMERSKDDNY